MTRSVLDTPAEPAGDAAARSGPGVCTNCGGPRAGEYCAECGQRAVRERLTVRGIARQIAHEAMNLDHGLLFTALELTRRPGAAVRDYLAGRRVPYTGPVKYFLLMVALATFASTQLGVTDEMGRELVRPMGESAPVTAQQVSRFIAQWMTLLMALGVPGLAAVTRLLFSRRGNTYADHLVLNLYVYAQQSLMLAVALGIAAIVRLPDSLATTGWMVLAAAYYAWACTSFFRVRARWGVPLALVALVVATVGYFMAVSFVVGVAVGFLSVARG